MFELADSAHNAFAKIKVVGIGGGGGNAISTMMSYQLKGVDFLAANTDIQALNTITAPIKIHLGAEITKGLGAGANPEVGRKAALESRDILYQYLEGSDDWFYHCWYGGRNGNRRCPGCCRDMQGNWGADGSRGDENPSPLRGEYGISRQTRALPN